MTGKTFNSFSYVFTANKQFYSFKKTILTIKLSLGYFLIGTLNRIKNILSFHLLHFLQTFCAYRCYCLCLNCIICNNIFCLNNFYSVLTAYTFTNVSYTYIIYSSHLQFYEYVVLVF